MSDDEKPLDLRDRLALEILNGLLSSDIPVYSTHGKLRSGNQHISDDYNSSTEANKESAKKRAEGLIRTAYMMADVMRKVRLTAFS